jgi:hypothetical protein
MDHHEISGSIKEALSNPEFAKTVAEIFANYKEEQEQTQHTQEKWVRDLVASREYRLMHRRKGQYWVIMAKPMSLDAIESWLDE